MLPQSSATVRPVALNSCGDRGAEWQALIDLGFLWASRDYARTGDYFRSALALARALGDSATIAQSLNRISNCTSIFFSPSMACAITGKHRLLSQRRQNNLDFPSYGLSRAVVA